MVDAEDHVGALHRDAVHLAVELNVPEVPAILARAARGDLEVGRVYTEQLGILTDELLGDADQGPTVDLAVRAQVIAEVVLDEPVRLTGDPGQTCAFRHGRTARAAVDLELPLGAVLREEAVPVGSHGCHAG